MNARIIRLDALGRRLTDMADIEDGEFIVIQTVSQGGSDDLHLLLLFLSVARFTKRRGDPALAKAPYGIGCWLDDFDPKTGKTSQITSGGGFGCLPFLDLKRNVAGVLLPYNRKWKVDDKGRRYNDAHRVYYEAKKIIDSILEGSMRQPPEARTPDKPQDEAKGEAREQADRMLRRLDRSYFS